MKRILTFIIIAHLGFGSCFAQYFTIGAGINYGGPLPTEVVDSTSGKPLPGLTAGASYWVKINERFSFAPGLYFSYRGLDYSQSFTRDTLFTVDINGNSGEVPSFYTAYVEGSMRLYYLDIPLLVSVRIKKFQMMVGPYFSLLVGGRDSGNVRVVIGSGGFFDDYTDVFNNYAVIRDLEHGIMLGSVIPIYKKLGLEFRASRSFITLYNLDKMGDHGQGSMKSYNTYIYFGLNYKLSGD